MDRHEKGTNAKSTIAEGPQAVLGAVFGTKKLTSPGRGSAVSAYHVKNSNVFDVKLTTTPLSARVAARDSVRPLWGVLTMLRQDVQPLSRG